MAHVCLNIVHIRALGIFQMHFYAYFRIRIFFFYKISIIIIYSTIGILRTPNNLFKNNIERIIFKREINCLNWLSDEIDGK